MTSRPARLLSLFALAMLLSACGGGGGNNGDDPALPGGGVPPQPGQTLQVVAIDPTPGTRDLERDAVLEVTFSALLDDAALPNPPLIVRQGGVVVPGTITHEAAAGVLRFAAVEPFDHRARIDLRVEPGVADVDGNVMTAPVEVAFVVRLPRTGDAVGVAEQDGFDEIGRLFDMNAAGQGILIHLEGSVVGPADLVATHYATPTGRVATYPLGTVRSFRARRDSLAVAANGDAILAWREFDGTDLNAYARRYDAATQTWENRIGLEISDLHDALDVRVSISDAGTLVVAWTRAPVGSLDADRVYVKTWRAAAGWNGSFGLQAGTGEVSELVAATGPQGHSVIAWTEQDVDGPHAQAVIAKPDGSWVARFGVDADSPHGAIVEDAAVDAQGRATVLYREERSGNEYALWSATCDVPAGTWGAPERIDDEPGLVLSPHCAVDLGGRLTVVWGGYHGTTATLRASRRPAGGTWQAPHVFAPTGVNLNWGIELDVAEDGTAAVSVNDQAPDVPRGIRGAVLDPTAQTWSPLQRVTVEAYDHYRPMALRAWRRGLACVAWSAPNGDVNAPAVRLRARWIEHDASSNPVLELDPAAFAEADAVGLGLDRDGRGVFVGNAYADDGALDFDVFERLID